MVDVDAFPFKINKSKILFPLIQLRRRKDKAKDETFQRNNENFSNNMKLVLLA